MLVKVRKLFLQFLLTAVGIFMIGSLPYLVFDDVDGTRKIREMLEEGLLNNASYLNSGIHFDFGSYFSQMGNTFMRLFHLNDMTYYNDAGKIKPLFPEMFTDFLYSMAILVAAMALAIVLAIVLTYLIMLCSRRFRKVIEFMLLILEAVPDLFLILVLQVLTIWFYKKTDFLLFNTISTQGDPTYALPILTLSVLPTLFVVKYLVQLFKEEEDKPYAELARGKGLRKSVVLLVHILRNTMLVLFYQSKSIFWVTLSSLLMLEIVFNIHGFTWFMWSYAPFTPYLLTVGLLMVFIPYFVLFSLGQTFLEEKVGVRNEAI